MNTWVKHYTDVILKAKMIRVMRVTYNANKPNFKQKTESLKLLKKFL